MVRLLVMAGADVNACLTTGTENPAIAWLLSCCKEDKYEEACRDILQTLIGKLHKLCGSTFDGTLLFIPTAPCCLFSKRLTVGVNPCNACFGAFHSPSNVGISDRLLQWLSVVPMQYVLDADCVERYFGACAGCIADASAKTCTDAAVTTQTGDWSGAATTQTHSIGP